MSYFTASTQQVWARDMRNVTGAIPAEWLVEYDSQWYVQPERTDERIVKLYHSLLTVGYANGWL